MKKIIFGILVCMLLITATILPVAGNTKIRCIIGKQTDNSSNVFDMDYLDDQTQIYLNNINLEKSRDRAYHDWILKAQQTFDNNYILIGVTETYGAGSRDAWLIKTDSNGDELWNKTWGRSSCDGTQSGEQTSDGGYILAGWGRWSPSWDTDFWLIKTDADGDEEWNKRYGSVGLDDTGYFVQQTSDNGYIFTGITKSYGAGDWDVWLVKTDGNGDEQWNNTFGGVLTDGGFVVRQTDDGGYIITGWVDSFGSGAHDVWLIKTDSNGDEMWNKTFGGTYKDSGHDVQQTSDGGYIIIGYTNSYGDYDRDFWLIKTDSSGNEDWNKTFEGADCYSGIEFMGHSGGMSVRQITDGYILVGTTDASFGNGPLSILMIQTDNLGNENWNKTFGGSSYDEGYWINETSDDGYIISGGTLSYGPPPGPNGWLIKTDSDGNEDWNKTFGGGLPGNKPPNRPSKPDGPDEGITGVEYTFNTSTSDPEGDDVYYLFDWGDGSTSDWIGPYASGSKASDSHSWDEAGEYKIKVKAKDEYDAESGWSLSLTIHIEQANRPPDSPTVNGPNRGNPNTLYDYIFNAVDPDGDEVKYYILWGDGYDDTSDFVPSGTNVTMSHSWHMKKTYTIKATAIDTNGLESDITEFEVVIPRYRTFNHNSNLYSWLFERFQFFGNY